jgi:uncharacterized membrane protein YgaE (UPF0421/DUF939 family)
MNINRKYKIGLRTIKTGIAVGLSMLLTEIMHLESPLFAGIGAISSMESSVSESFISGKNRMLGTFVGAIIGLVFSSLLPQNYIFLSIGIILIIYINNIIGWKKSLQLSCYVYLSIFLSDVDERIPYVTYRLLATFVGLVVGTLINYFIAAPNVKISFIEGKKRILETSKNLIYELITNEREIDLIDFYKEMTSLEDRFNLYKQELNYNFKEKQISKSSVSILKMIEEIYNDLHTLLRLEIKPILNKRNADLFTIIYLKDYVPDLNLSCENTELDIVYNFHLNRIFNNLIDIEKLLNE